MRGLEEFADELPRGEKREVVYWEGSVKAWERFQDAASDVWVNLREAASQTGMTVRDISLSSGVSERTLWDMSKGATDVRLSTLLFLAAAVGVDPADLLLPHRKFKAQQRTREARSR